MKLDEVLVKFIHEKRIYSSLCYNGGQEGGSNMTIFTNNSFFHILTNGESPVNLSLIVSTIKGQ